MKDDPIVAEVHRIREDLAVRFNNDMAALTRYLKEEAIKSGRTFISFPPRRVKSAEKKRAGG